MAEDSTQKTDPIKVADSVVSELSREISTLFVCQFEINYEKNSSAAELHNMSKGSSCTKLSSSSICCGLTSAEVSAKHELLFCVCVSWNF